MEKDDMSLRVDSFSCYLDTPQEKAMNSTSSLPAKPQPPPPPFTSIMFSKSQDSLANLRVDSLSSYLNSTGDTASNFVFEIPRGSVEDPNLAFTFSREVAKDGEIGVFNADRYFNMKLEYKAEPKKKYEEEVRPQPKPKTPSSCLSETSSSWNSQTALVPDNLRRNGSQKHKRAIGRKIFMGFGCKGPCFDKKSIADFSSKLTRTGSERVDRRNMITAEKNQIKIGSLDESRPSIEVFGSSNRMKGDIATKLERKLSMLTWDAIPKDKTVIPTPPSTIICDDMASEASSDLFEIENISGSTNFQPGDDTSTCMSPSSYYAPSEASIQWSVVTASAAGYSVLSEFNDEPSVSVAGDLVLRNANSTNHNKNAKTKVEVVQKTRAGGILGCKNQRSVDVVVCQKSGLDTPKHNLQGKDISVSSSIGKSGYRAKDCADSALRLPRTLAINGGHSYPSIL